MSTDHHLSAQPAGDLAIHARELAAVSLMLGAVLLLWRPFGLVWALTAWSVGAVLMWVSPHWSTRAKTIGTFGWPGGLIGPALMITSIGQVCTQAMSGGSGAPTVLGERECTGFAFEPWLGIPVLIISVGVPFAVAIHLLRELNGDRPS